MNNGFHIGDPVRVRKGYPFAGYIGQVHSVHGEGRYGVNLELYSVPTNLPQYELAFRGEELELIMSKEESSENQS